jgi:CHASE2 domain-containing sensor protein
VSKRQQNTAEKTPWKLLLWATIAALIFGAVGFGQIAEDFLRTTRNSLHWHKASGDIVLVKIDDESLRQIGRWPWPRRYHAELTDALTNAGAKRIFFDVAFFGPTDRADDQQLAEALRRSGRVTLAVRHQPGLDPLFQRLHRCLQTVVGQRTPYSSPTIQSIPDQSPQYLLRMC